MFFNKLQQSIIVDYGKSRPKHNYHYGKAADGSVVIVVDGTSCYRIPVNDFALSLEWLEQETKKTPLTAVDKLIPEEKPYDYQRIYYRCAVPDERVNELAVFENKDGSIKVFLNPKLYKEYLKEFEIGYELTFWAKDDRSPVYACLYDTVIACILPVIR